MAQVHTNLNALKNAECPQCGCPFFETDVCIYKKLPAIESPTGKAQMIRLALGRCADCGLIVLPKEDTLQAVSIERTDVEQDEA